MNLVGSWQETYLDIVLAKQYVAGFFNPSTDLFFERIQCSIKKKKKLEFKITYKYLVPTQKPLLRMEYLIFYLDKDQLFL